jgi:hypothetical protein
MPLSRKQFTAIEQLMEDSRPCTRLTDWEEEFLSTLRPRVKQYRENVYISPAQLEKIKQIEEKVYAVG